MLAWCNGQPGSRRNTRGPRRVQISGDFNRSRDDTGVGELLLASGARGRAKIESPQSSIRAIASQVLQ